MPPKTRGAKAKAKSHVFPTKAAKKGKSSKAAAKSKPDTSPSGSIEDYLVKRPNKKSRTEEPPPPKKKLGLLDLPPEIRLMIYGHVVKGQHPPKLFVHRGDMEKRGPKARIKPKRGSTKTRYLVKCCDKTSFETTYVARNACCLHHQNVEWSLMWVCSVIRKEVMPLMFEDRHVHTVGLDATTQFLKDLTPDQRASIRHLNVDHCCDQIISPVNASLWTDTFKYIAENLQLKTLYVEARSNNVDIEDDAIWDQSDPKFTWAHQISKMRNLDSVEIVVKDYDPELGYEVWADWVNEGSEDFEDGEPEYDPSFDWIVAHMFSEDITWQVARKVLSRTAWEDLKEKQPTLWKMVCDNRRNVLDGMVDDGATDSEIYAFFGEDTVIDCERSDCDAG